MGFTRFKNFTIINVLIFLVIFLTGCTSHSDFELEILTKELNCKTLKLDDYPKYMKMDTIAVEESRTIVVYKLTNNTDKVYYFNLDDYSDEFRSKYIKMDRAYIAIYDSYGKFQKFRKSQPSGSYEKESLYAEYLNYNYRGKSHADNRNFIIHPKETLYFEWFVVLPFGNMSEAANCSVILDSLEKYYAEVLLKSDTTNYKKSLSRTDLQTIQDNKYEIFNGTIKSKNRIPIVFKE